MSDEDFQSWLFEMDDALERFLSLLPSHLRPALDFSPGSLDVLEQWILERYAGVSEILEPGEALILDGLARYVGETFREQLGGYWQIRFDNPKDAHYGLPELTGFSPRPTPLSPHSLVTASTDRRSGNYISTVLANVKKRYNA